MLAITVNTNKAATTAAQEQVLKEDLRRFITERLTLPEVWAKLINISPSFDAVDHIDVSAIGIERGGKRHRIHAHFVVTIQHHGSVNWRGTQRPWQAEVNSFLTYASSSNVSVDLLNARSLNYVTKGSGTAGTGKALAVLGVQEAVVF
jgi:hypothetical protein